MSDELVERVARALLRADHEHAYGPTADWDEADPTERIYFLAGAEAAIAEVREWDMRQLPSPAEIEAGMKEYENWNVVQAILENAAVVRAGGEAW